jgi:carboxypeptidase D
MKEINERDKKCGFTKYLDEALTYPPPSNFPATPDPYSDGCQVWDDITTAAALVNPCFNIYHLTDFCPYPWDVMGFPSLAGGPNDYFNRSDVQKVLHAPPTDYSICGGNIFPQGDSSVPSALGPLPKVIEATNNVLIGHGWYDYLLIMNGTLATIQNMTWNGAQGFQRPPTEPLIVPYTSGMVADPNVWDGGAGVLGTAHTERGLTFSTVYGSGHGTSWILDFRIIVLTASQKSPNTFPAPHIASWNSCSDESRACKTLHHLRHRSRLRLKSQWHVHM